MSKVVPENLEMNESVSAIRKALKEIGRPLSQFKKEFEAQQNIDARKNSPFALSSSKGEPTRPS